MLHVASAVAAAAAGQPFNPQACAEAAKAFKHAAFARTLERRTAAVAKLDKELKAAHAKVLEELSSSAPATKLIRQLGPGTPRPTICKKPGAAAQKMAITVTLQKSESVKHAPKNKTIVTSYAQTIADAWTLRHETATLTAEVCASIPVSSDHDAVARAIAAALHGCIKPAAGRIRAALAKAKRLDSAPPAKRLRSAPGAAGPGPNG